MPIPWLTALRLIPWDTLISHAPAIKRRAEAAASEAREAQRAHGQDLRALTARIEALEARSQAEADLVRQIAQQLQDLTVASEVLAAQIRWIVVAGFASAILALAALVVAIVR